jgi:drug/metabolite transporter (DMT)-like permease
MFAWFSFKKPNVRLHVRPPVIKEHKKELVGIIICYNYNKPMKQSLKLILTALAAIVLFGVLVHIVLVVAHVSEPATTTVYGLTSQRIWASTAAILALVGVIIGGLALRFVRRIGRGRIAAIVALVVGLIAMVIGGLNLAIANGGPGSGNGVVGAAAALVLGLVATILGGLAMARFRRTG